MKFTINNIGFNASIREGGGSVNLEAETLDEAAELVFNLWGADPEDIEDNELYADEMDYTLPPGSHTQNAYDITPQYTEVLDVLGVNEKFGCYNQGHPYGEAYPVNKPAVIAHIKQELKRRCCDE